MRVLVHGLASYTKGGIETYVLEMAKYLPEDIIFDYVIEENDTTIKMPGKATHCVLNLKSKCLAI